VEPQNYIFPELHAEIGLVNKVLNNFYAFFDDQVEAVTLEDSMSRNLLIVADVVLTMAKQQLSKWKEDVAPQLEFYWYEQIQVGNELKRRYLDPIIITELRSKLE
jgi:hypothetical protein